MATKEQKIKALNAATEVAKQYASAGGGSPEVIIERTYEKIVKIVDEIEQSQD